MFIYSFVWIFVFVYYRSTKPHRHCVAVCHISHAMLPEALCVAQALTAIQCWDTDRHAVFVAPAAACLPYWSTISTRLQ